MWIYMKMSFTDKLLLLLPLSALLSAQFSNNSDFKNSSMSGPTSSASNVSSTIEEELAGSMQSSSVSTNSQVVVDKEEQDWSMLENYLYTGDASALMSSSCHNSFQLTALHGAIPQDIKAHLYQTTVSMTSIVNFLNLIFQASELREISVREDIEWYHALIRSILVGKRIRLVRHALLSFAADPTALQPQLILWATKGSTQDIYLQDLTMSWEKRYLLPHGLDKSWFTLLKSKSQSFPSLSKLILLNDLSTLDTPKWAHGDTYITNISGLLWGEAPFLECKEGGFLPGWLLTLSMPFYGLKPDLSPEFRGMIRVDVNIQDFDVNQCAIGDFWFADTHQCNRTSMECEPIPRQGFRLGQYCCRCKEGYYSQPTMTDDQLDDGPNDTLGCYPVIPVCVPCWPGCKQCQDGSPCWIQEDWHLRAGLLTVHSFFVAFVLISMLRVYQCRRTRVIKIAGNSVTYTCWCDGPPKYLWLYKPIRASGLLLLEIILFGSLLLYFPVLIIFFKPSTFRCILLRWVRLLGFAIVYGTVTLKMYRVLNVFLSCTAQKVPYMSSTSVLRILGVMVLTVKWFLSAWTVGVLQNQDRNISLLVTLTTSDGRSFRVCDLDRWDYMMAMAELLFLCWGTSLSGAVKTVPSAFHEARYMGIAVHNELLFSTVFHLFRFIKPSLHPDWMLFLFFIHIHVTVTVTLGLMFIPKFLHIFQLIKEDMASEMYEDVVDPRRSCLHLNNSFTSACWSDHNLDPDDIRGELKKLYAQLEVHKTKKMEKNNPHLQKKRSSRLRLGRSLIRRIAEIPESISRQGSHEDKDASAAGETEKGSGSCLATSEGIRVITRNETAKLLAPEIQQCVLVSDSSVKNCMSKSGSDTESIDMAPLFCRSVSAQNLAIDNNPLQPVSTRVQKSFSFPEKHRNHCPLSPTTNMVEELHVCKTSPKYMTYDKVKVKEEEPTGANMSNQKHVSCTYFLQEKPKPKLTSPPALLYVCPWEFASSLPSSSPSVMKRESFLDSDLASSRSMFPMSSSAPGSPYSFMKPMASCGVSFYSAPQTLLLARGLMAKKGNDKDSSANSSENELRKEKGRSQQTRSMTLSNAIKSMKKSPQPQKRSMTCVDSKPCLVKQAGIRESPVSKSISHVPPRIHLWESEAMECESTSQCQNSDPQRLTPSIENPKPSWHQGVQSRASLTVPSSTVCRWDAPNKTCRQKSIVDICPWEVKPQDLLQPKGFFDDDSIWDVDSKHKEIISMVKGTSPRKSLEQASRINNKSRKGTVQHPSHTKSEVFPCSVKQGSAKSVSEATKPPERVIYVNAHPDTKKQPLTHQETLRTDVCLWVTSDTSTNQEIMCVDVYPWKSDARLGKYSETIRSTVSKQLSSTAGMDFSEKSEKLLKTDAETPKDGVNRTTIMTKQLTSMAETCPWDYPELLPTLKEVYLLESEEASLKLKPEETLLSTQESTTNQTDSSSQEAEVAGRPEVITKDADTLVVKKKEKVQAKICRWENITLESEEPVTCSQKQTSLHGNVDLLLTGECEEQIMKNKSTYAEICPWETEEGGKTAQNSSQNDHQAYLYPEVSERSKTQAGVCVDVSLLEADSERPYSIGERREDLSARTAPGVKANRPLTRCDALCPWEMKAGSQAFITEHDNSDIFAWEKPIAEEESDAETAAEAIIFLPDL